MGVAILFKFVFSCFQVLAWPLLSLVYPLYASFEALERNSISDTQKLISYWICFAAISLFEYSASVLLQWVPFWAYVKLSIICCLVAPQFDGSLYMYKRFIHRYKNMKKRFCLRVSFILLETKNYFGEIEADQASQSSKEVEQPNVECRTEPKKTAAVEQTENAGVGKTKQITDIIANISHKSNEIEDKRSCEECQIGCIDVTAVERIENAGGGSTEQVTEIATDISLDKVEDRDSQHSLSIMKVQKEWTCEVCEMKTTGESDLQSHLPGKGHKVACEILKSKSGSTTGEQCTTGITTRKHINQHEADCELLKTHQSHGHATSIALPTILCNSRQHEQGTAKNCTTNEIKNHQWWCAICNISCTGKGNMDSHLKGSEHMEKIKNSHGDGDKGKIAAMPMQRAEPKDVAAVEQIENEISLDVVEDQDFQDLSSIGKMQKKWTCEVCEVRTSSWSDLQSHLQGKRHKVNCEILKSKCEATTRELLKTHEPINNVMPPCYATSADLPTVPCNSKKQGAAKSCTSEIKDHQWRCALCNVRCKSKVDLNAHLNGSKHLAKIKRSHGDSGTGKTATMPKLKAEKEKTSKQNDLVKEPVLDGLVRNNGRRAGWWWSIQK